MVELVAFFPLFLKMVDEMLEPNDLLGGGRILQRTFRLRKEIPGLRNNKNRNFDKRRWVTIIVLMRLFALG